MKHSAYLSTQLQGTVSVAKLGNKSLVARLMAIINPRRACTARVTVHVVVLCVFVCVCLSVRLHPNLWTGTSRHLTEDTSGLSGTFFTNMKRLFL